MVDDKMTGTMIHEINRIDFGMWTQQRWAGGKIL